MTLKDSHWPASVDFTAVVHEHWNAVFQLAYSLSGNAHEAEDLTQETFTRAIARISGFQPGTNMRAWLLRIASNLFFDEQRRRKLLRRHELNVDMPADERPVGRDLEVDEQANLIRKAMNDLTELTRLVFHLRVQEELSFREIAEMAGTTEQAARWHMRQARVKLLASLGGDAPLGDG